MTGGVGGTGIVLIMTGAGVVGGASAVILLGRSFNFASRAFNGPVAGTCMPPAAGSISSSQGPHEKTEST